MKKITLIFAFMLSVVGFAQAPTVDPNTPPARNPGDVISIYSDAYDNIAGADYNPNWSQSGFGTANTAYDTGTGNLVLAYPNFNYQGIDLNGSYNVAGMEFLHVDIWTDGGVAPNVYIISPGPVETPYAIPNSPGVWQSFDIPLGDFSPVDLANLIQFKFDGGNGTTSAIYVDNLYFWKNPITPADDATLSDLQVDGATIDGFSPTVFDYSYELVVGTVTVPQITLATPTEEGNGAMATITQASGIPGDATVEVTSSNGNVTETYTISFIATLPDTPPTPVTPDGDVALSLFNDNPGYTNAYVAEGSFGVRNVVELGPSNDEVIKMDFSVDSWGQFNNTTVDISSAGFMHFNYFAPDLTPGPDGHEFYIMINSGSGEKFYTFKTDGSSEEDIVFGSWQTVVIPMSFWTNQGFDPSTFLVWKLGTPSTAFTTVVYFDNIYFSASNPLSTEEFVLSDFDVYPNPTQDVWNVKTNNQEISSIQVVDIQGRQVLDLKINTTGAIIDASSLPAGLYFARINTAIGTKSVKLIKQ
ncbi:T9SS type A sorting domain-containing protein [Hanstruepera flava]|uniref:T9SS type A sorting domain-containing protein n=1 Tax=Hanstruepera flava TaxID=2930218 RepID=UPI002028F6EA|nr:T9SS type A sorting domain-containing protein [Hanstruepera flava]